MAHTRTLYPNQIRRFRKLAGYSQKDVAAILRFKSTSRISRWEKGLAFPNHANLLKLSILYCTLPAQLYSDYYEQLREEVLASRNALFLRRNTA